MKYQHQLKLFLFYLHFYQLCTGRMCSVKKASITRCSNTVPALRASTRQFVSSAFSESLREVFRKCATYKLRLNTTLLFFFRLHFLSQLKSTKRAKAAVSIASPAVRLTLWSVSRSSRPFHWRAKFTAVLAKWVVGKK